MTRRYELKIQILINGFKCFGNVIEEASLYPDFKINDKVAFLDSNLEHEIDIDGFVEIKGAFLEKLEHGLREFPNDQIQYIHPDYLNELKARYESTINNFKYEPEKNDYHNNFIERYILKEIDDEKYIIIKTIKNGKYKNGRELSVKFKMPSDIVTCFEEDIDKILNMQLEAESDVDLEIDDDILPVISTQTTTQNGPVTVSATEILTYAEMTRNLIEADTGNLDKFRKLYAECMTKKKMKDDELPDEEARNIWKSIQSVNRMLAENDGKKDNSFLKYINLLYKKYDNFDIKNLNKYYGAFNGALGKGTKKGHGGGSK